MTRKDYITVQYPDGILDYPKELDIPRIGEKLTFTNEDLNLIFHKLKVVDIIRNVWVKNTKTKIKSTMTEIQIILGGE